MAFTTLKENVMEYLCERASRLAKSSEHGGIFVAHPKPYLGGQYIVKVIVLPDSSRPCEGDEFNFILNETHVKHE